MRTNDTWGYTPASKAMTVVGSISIPVFPASVTVAWLNANSFAQYWKRRGRSYTPLSNVSYLTNNGNFKVLLYDKCNIGDVLAIAHADGEVHHMMFISGK
ncbi:hypothetical protein LGL08_22855 [Clostridium estertheticum]|uniref:amidase domain-containing protein n=1 Tax=Clostridium estertheticum TaxID=238834 RepID=UPI001CF2CF6F|nr:hypothetical protein [Clostridium estertheticum]MCB2309379.1 hypothetical protein [Clostridium estertheticum]MCB2347826.1 hypothetical protein [Clostridium estertheticum]MCB2352355.1 hypothetical protein [Clostridium estertheticum]WAG48327.1 hypothetical protein LL127_22770 [Clostridium estertheticum]